MSDHLYQVAVDAPLLEPLTYSLENLKQGDRALARGTAVQVPLGKRTVKGVVVGNGEHSGDFSLKSISAVNDELPLLHEPYLKWVEWVSQYYQHPIGKVFQSTFPPLKRNSNRKTQKAPVIPQVKPSDKLHLTEEQTRCLQPLLSNEKFQPFLLHGVTGSGKTEVYLQLLEKVLNDGKTALVLVPEISLTPQLIQRFAARFQDRIAVIHSHLTEREKTNQWWSVVSGEKPILIGARSALFCPIENLGAIIVDEEHEASFKQDEKLKYNGRDAAIMLGKFHDCTVVLGSATPSLESWQNAKSGKYHLLQMKARVQDRKMPTVEIVDLKELKEQGKDLNNENSNGLPFWLSQPLFEAIKLNLESGMQTALFLNRRGTAQMSLCTACGTQFECPNCAISLTLHGKSHLVCHYCDYSQMLPHRCTSCDSDQIEKIGLGTELIEQDIRKLFPSIRIARADRDEVTSRQDLEDLIQQVEEGEVDILIGTQMIAKGLDFPKLTVVGLVLADVGFNIPDFRATERSFQLLTQVSGRAGRHIVDGGKVIIQTFNPDHPSIQYSQKADFEGFADFELMERKDLNYPPFGRVVLVRMSSNQNSKTEQLAQLVRHRCHQLQTVSDRYHNVQILGPCPAPLVKIRNSYRHQLLLKSSDALALQNFCRQLIGDKKWIPSGAKVQVDVDPMNMM